MTRLGTRTSERKERVIEKFLVCAIDALSFHYSTRAIPHRLCHSVLSRFETGDSDACCTV